MRPPLSIALLALFISPLAVFSQQLNNDSVDNKSITLQTVVLSVNKIGEPAKLVAQAVQVLNTNDIISSQSQTTADLIASTGNVFIQKSQLGGGSVTIRGFEANRNLLVIDGVRMNNLIYRAGHLQNILTTDNNAFERVEILYGPASTIYGSDALGGVIHLYTKRPLLSADGKKNNIKATVFSRYGTVNNESTNHIDFNFGAKKIASLTSFTYSAFGDLKGGTNQNPFYTGTYGERPYYVERINGTDVLVKNANRYLQVQSGYSQYDMVQKFLFQQNKFTTHELNIQYSTSTDVPRYDRLTDPNGSGLNYAQWYYGPQKRLLTAYDMNIKQPKSAFQNIHLGINYQDVEESRHTRKFNNNSLSHRYENVKVIGANLDFNKIINKHDIRFGLDAQYNLLSSTANKENISTGNITKLDTRYPDGDNSMLNAALYLSHTWKINDQTTLVDGIRAGYAALHSTISDNSFFNLPVTKVDQNNAVYSGNIGVIHNPSDDWKLSALVSTGFRVANMDDLSKVFESAGGAVIIPNPNLKPEKTINTELGITKIFNQHSSWENSIYYTQFIDAIVTDKFMLNGQDSILYDGTKSQVFANQNKGKAYIYGFSSTLKSNIDKNFSLQCSINYTYGRIKTDSSDSPLDHIPPFMAKLSLTYANKKFNTNFFIHYNGAKKIKDYYLNGEDNEQYATPTGMPAWLTANWHAAYSINNGITILTGIDNIFDTQYRSFSSGINAPGRNLFATVRFQY